jgi:hypothetical protein
VSGEPERRLSVFFEAGKTRFAVEAVSVSEVARPDAGEETLRGHLILRDLSALLGGAGEQRPGTAIVLDTSPTTAIRVREVEGVFDTSTDPHFSLPGRMIPLLGPAVRGAWVHEGRLVFELEPESAVRGLGGKGWSLAVCTLPVVTTPCLVCDAGARSFALPLPRVLQVVPKGPHFNPAPGEGAFQGAIVHQQVVCPIFSLTGESEPFIVLVEAKGEVMGISVTRADGVRPANAIGAIPVLDLDRTFG